MKDKVVIITGATSGIGKALVYEFARSGSKIVIGARNYELLSQIADDIKQHGGEALYVQTDVSIESDCRNLILTAIDNYGKIDILINNAGISMRALFEFTEIKVLNHIMDVNFWGTVYATKYALPFILEQKGSIVGVSSIAGMKGLPARTGYSASKFAMSGFLEALRIENLKKGLHVLVAFPGFTSSNIRNNSLCGSWTQQAESPRDENKMMTAEEVAKHIYKAVVKRKNKIVLTSQGKLVYAINKVFPNFLNKMVYNSLAKEPDSPFN